MKKTIRIFCAAALFLFDACTTDEFNMSVPSVGGITKFNVETESATKAVFGNDLSVTWAVGDSIKIFANGVAAKFKADAAGTSSSFTIAPDQTPLADTTVYFGVASYTAGWSVEGDVITTTIPTYQTAAPGSINPKYLLMAARSTDLNLSMKNLVSLIKITLSDDNVTSVNITAKGGAKISGPTTVTLSGAGDPEIVASTPYIVLVPERNDDGTLKECFEPGDYYIAAAPAAISAGIEVVLFNKDNTDLGIKSSGSACNLYRSEVMYLDDLCSVIEWVPTVTTGLTFWVDGTGFVNPFVSPALTLGTSVPKDETEEEKAKYSPVGERDVLINAVADTKNGGLSYNMFSQKGYWKNSSQGFRSFMDEGDYIEFPAFEGLSLKAVKWTFGYQGYNNYPGLAASDGQFVVGGEPLRTYTQTGDFTVWTNLNTSENTAYRITPSSSGSVVSCRNFTLYYTGTPVPTVISVKTGSVSNITGTGVTVAGTFTAFASSDIESDFECGVEYKTGSGAWTSVPATSVSTSFSVALTGLTEGSTYTVRAWAKAKTGEKVYGAESSFIPSDIMTISLTGWNYTEKKFTNPFTGGKLPTGNSSGQNYDGTLTLGSYSYHFHASTTESGASKYSSIHTNGNNGFRFISMGLSDTVAPTYVSIPVVTGKRLVSVSIINTGSGSGPVFVSSNVSTGTAAASAKLDKVDITPTTGSADSPTTATGNFVSAVVGTQYYLVFGSGSSSSTAKNYTAEIKFSYSK